MQKQIDTLKGEEKQIVVQSQQTQAVTIKHFPITEEESFVQYTVRMNEDNYNKLTDGENMD